MKKLCVHKKVEFIVNEKMHKMWELFVTNIVRIHLACQLYKCENQKIFGGYEMDANPVPRRVRKERKGRNLEQV